jgi:flagellar basal-body rod protein FlgC
MDYGTSFAVSAAGMAVERARVDAAAQNLANASAAQAPGSLPYQPLRAVVRSGLGQVEGSGVTFAEHVGRGLDAAALQAVGLPEVVLEPVATPARLVHDPGHPLADPQGFVAYPGVDTATEMVELMSAMRAYEANVAAMGTSRALALKTLEIGGTP